MVPMPPLVWALGRLKAGVGCPVGVVNRAKYINSVKTGGLTHNSEIKTYNTHLTK